MMKKTVLILVLSLTIIQNSMAPANGIINLSCTEPIIRTPAPIEWMLAIIEVESGNKGSVAKNPLEPLAGGKFQQYPIFVDDVNRILGFKKYTLQDRFDNRKSEEMFWVYQGYYNPEMSFEKMCRIQCGGPKGYMRSGTLDYYNLVKTALLS